MKHFETPPTLQEIAEKLSVVQRWNGATTIPWTVLQHSLLTTALLPKDASVYIRLVAMLHDAVEAFMGDIPRGYKVPEQYAFEGEILKEIYEGLDIPWPGESAGIVREVDDLAALVEAQVLVYPQKRREVWANTTVLASIHATTGAIKRGEDLVWEMRDMNRQDAISTWVKGVEGLIAFFTLETDDFYTEGQDAAE